MMKNIHWSRYLVVLCFKLVSVRVNNTLYCALKKSYFGYFLCFHFTVSFVLLYLPSTLIACRGEIVNGKCFLKTNCCLEVDGISKLNNHNYSANICIQTLNMTLYFSQMFSLNQKIDTLIFYLCKFPPVGHSFFHRLHCQFTALSFYVCFSF